MRTQNDESAALARPRDAANDAFLTLQDDALHSGWDPYEVWRARIKTVYDLRVALARQGQAVRIIAPAAPAPSRGSRRK